MKTLLPPAKTKTESKSRGVLMRGTMLCTGTFARSRWASPVQYAVLMLCLAAIAVFCSPAAFANNQKTFFQNADLSNAANYNPAGLPTATDDVTITTSSTALTLSAASITVGSLNVTNSTNYTITTATTGSTNSTITLNGGNTSTGASAADLIYVGNTGSLTINSASTGGGGGKLGITLAANGNFDVTSTNTVGLTIGSIVSGAFNLTKTGAGALGLNQSNTFGGAGKSFTLQDGTVSYNNAASFGAVATTVNFGSATTAPTSTLVVKSTAGVTVANTPINFNQDVTFSGTSTATFGSFTQVININGARTITNSQASSNLVLGSVAGGKIQSGTSGTNSLTLTGTSIFNPILATIQDGTGTLALIYNSTSAAPGRALNLTSASNSYSGGTTLTAGILNFVSGALGTGPITFNTISTTSGYLQYATGNTQDISSRIAPIASGKVATIDTNNNAVTFATTNGLTGAGGFAKLGLGTLTIPVANNYSGTTVIGISSANTGSLAISNSTALGTGTLSLQKQLGFSGSLQLSGGITVANTITSNSSNLTTNPQVPGQVSIESVSGSNTLSGSITINGTGGQGINFQSDAGSTLTLSGPLTASGSATGGRTDSFGGTGDIVVSGTIANGTATLAIQKDGLGTLTLTGNNTNTGTTTINGGTLQVGNGGSTGTLGNAVATTLLTNNGSLIFNRSGALAVNNPITGSGSVTQMGSGTTTLSGVGTYTGGTIITGGVLVNNNTTAGSGPITGTIPANKTGTFASSSTTITITSGSTSDLVVGGKIVGTGLYAGTTIASFTATTITVKDASVAASPAAPGASLSFPNSISGLSSTTGLVIGQAVTGANIPAGAVITAIPAGGTSVLISKDVTGGQGTSTAITFGSGSAIPTGSNMTLGGGTFSTGGRSLTLGALTLTDGSASNIDLGTGASVLKYQPGSGSALLNSGSGTPGTLQVLNYSGRSSGGGTDQLFFGDGTTPLTMTQLGEITFVNPNGTSGTFAAQQLSSGEVVPVNNAPTAITLSSSTVAENSASGTAVGTLTTTDPDTGDTFTYTLTDNAGGRFAISGNQLVVGSTNIDYETTPTLSVTVRSTDANGGSFDQQFTITVTNVNEAPVNTVPGNQTVTSGGTLTFNTANGNAISIADVDAGTGSLTVTLTATNGTITLSQTTGLTFTTGDGTTDATMTFSGTLADINAALNGATYNAATTSGADTFTITTNDNGNTGPGGPLSDTDSFNIAVTPGAATQFVVTAPANVTAGTPFTVTVTAKDANGNTATGYTGTVHFTSTDNAAALPADFTFAASNNGSKTFSVTLNTPGSQSITATDTTTASITGTTNVTVASANTAPVANTIDVAVQTSTPKTFTLDATDANGDALTFLIVSAPTNGTLTDASGATLTAGSTLTGTPNNQVTYTPTTGYTGPDSFTYKANDGLADSNTATVTLTVADQTAVKLINFRAFMMSQDGVWIDWRTGLERENLGFNLYRQTRLASGKWGARVKMNSSLIAGADLQQGRNASVQGGFGYAWLDKDAPGNVRMVRYWLQDVDVHGKSVLHGPISPSPSNLKLNGRKRSPMTSELQP